ncbi:flavocytochrome c [Ligilactobacillus sp.]|uniref:flavocytochrome c n=1 Tax=Ligilactobacillus sp. TaxID=2767921 RepID=UPI002FDFE286
MANTANKPNDSVKEDYDLIVIGSGCAGLTCAIQARELGLKPVILEKMETFGGNSMRASSGMNASETIVQLKHGIVEDWHDFYDETYKGGGKLNDPELLEYFASHGALAIDWLAAHGIVLDDLTITGGMSRMRTHRPKSLAPIGAFLVNNLMKRARELEIPVLCGIKAEKLLTDEKGAVCGVRTDRRNFHARAVVLATGGFSASKDLIARYRPDLKAYRTTNHAGATGDGIKLAEEVGAQVMQMDLVQVHPTVQQDTDHAYLIGEAVRGEGAVLVDGNGKRFVNELSTRRIVSDAITALKEKSAYLVFDSQVKKRVKAVDFYQKQGLVVEAGTLEELAGKLNVGKNDLKQTLEKWNQAVEGKQDSEFGRRTGMERKLNQAPYYAIHIAPAIHYTMGGLHIDRKTHVLDKSGDVISGLFACGEVCGGLHGNNRIGGNSISETVIFGRQAGMQAAAEVRNK